MIEKPKKTNKQVVAHVAQQMDLFLQEWPDHVRGIPNVHLRTAIFSISQKRALFKKMTLIASTEDIEIYRQGEQFNQDDLDVWATLIHLARKQALNTHVRFTVNGVLTELGLTHGGGLHKQLHEAINRLMGGLIEIRWVKEGKKVTDTLIKKSFYDENEETYVVVLSEDLLKIFKMGYTQINWEERQLYKKNSLARWLLGFYSSHASPYDYHVKTLKALSGSSPKGRLTDFRKALVVALNLLVEKKSFLKAEIIPDRDVVSVTRIPSASQKRHLAKKVTQKENAQLVLDVTAFDAPQSSAQ